MIPHISSFGPSSFDVIPSVPNPQEGVAPHMDDIPGDVAATIMVKSAMATQVDTWIDREKTKTIPHTDIFNFCENLSAEQNWDMLTYALQVMKSKLPDLNGNMRLLWIIQDNLQTLTDSLIAAHPRPKQKISICFENRLAADLFKPPLAIIEALVSIIKEIQLVASPSTNLTAIQHNLARWTKALDLICEETTPFVMTCRDVPLHDSWSTIKMPHLTSYLFESKVALEIDNEGASFYMFGVSAQDCGVFPGIVDSDGLFMQGLQKKGLSICVLDQLPTTLQEEFRGASSELPVFLGGVTSKIMKKVTDSLPAEMRDVMESLDQDETVKAAVIKSQEFAAKLPMEAHMKLVRLMSGAMKGTGEVTPEIYNQILDIYRRHLSEADFEEFKAIAL